MGFFSWKTQDTDKSISNTYSNRPTFPVVMIDDKGNVWHEPEYDGYGEFGGKDYYELLAEMNGVTEGDTETKRMAGIEMAFKDNGTGDHTPNVKYPNLVEMAEGWTYQPIGPESCPEQGFFYNNSDEDDDEWGADDEWDEDDVDPAGGHGLHSHI